MIRPGYRRGGSDWLVRAIRVLAPLYGIQKKKAFGTYSEDSLGVAKELNPGHSLKLRVRRMFFFNGTDSKCNALETAEMRLRLISTLPREADP